MSYWNHVDSELRGAGVTRAQVQAVWLKNAHASVAAGFLEHADAVSRNFQSIVRIIMNRMRLVSVVYLTSSSYAAYATAPLSRRAAADAGINVVIGVNERNIGASGTTLYNAMLVIGADGHLHACHRKLVPTVAERIVHGQGDGSTLAVHELDIGRLGGLICWENYMPLARYAMYAWGAQIYVAPTWDRGEPWISTLRHIAKEGRVYVIGCCTPMRRDDIPDRYSFKAYLPETEWINPGESTIIDPDGKFLIEPVREREEILLAEIDPRKLAGSRFQLDVAGHYARPDVFELTVRRAQRPLVRTIDERAADAISPLEDGQHARGDDALRLG